jgi:hypothetical protein
LFIFLLHLQDKSIEFSYGGFFIDVVSPSKWNDIVS